MSLLRKIRLPKPVEFSLRLPVGAQLLFARTIGRDAYLYATVDDNEAREERFFCRIRKTDSQPLPAPTRFVRFIAELDSTLLFEVPPPAPQPAKGGTSA